METTTVSPAKEKWMAVLGGSHEFTNGLVTALDAFDFPTTRDEDWKYTRVARITNEAWVKSDAVESCDIQQYLIPGLDAYTVVFVNGRFNAAQSTLPAEQGIHASHEAKIAKHRASYNHFFQAYADAACTDVVNVLVEKTRASASPFTSFMLLPTHKCWHNRASTSSPCKAQR